MRTEIQTTSAAAVVTTSETTTQKLLRLAKARQGIPSNYKLRQVLDVSEVTITRWNQGRGAPANAVAMRLADMAGLDPGVVIAEISAERAQDDDERNLWLGIAARLRHAGMAVIVGAFCTFAAPPEAQAYEVGQHADQSDAVRYVNRRKRRRTPGGRRKGDGLPKRKPAARPAQVLRLH